VTRVDRAKTVTDNDTVVLRGGTGKNGSFRLVGFDAPESKQDPAVTERGTAFLADVLDGSQVEVSALGVKSHGRETGNLFVDGENVGVQTVKRGNAWAIRKPRTAGFASTSDPAMYLAERVTRAKALAAHKAGERLTLEEHGVWRHPELHEELRDRVKDPSGVFMGIWEFMRHLGAVPRFDVRGDPVGAHALFGDDVTVGVVRSYDPEKGNVVLESPGGKRQTRLLSDLAGGMGLVQFLPAFEKHDPRVFDDKRRGR